MKRLEKFTHRQAKSLIEHLGKYAHHLEPETLHKIRVDVKKVKAVLGAINGCVKGFRAHKNFIPFRNIFRRAGEVREPEVLARLLRQYKVNGNRLFGDAEGLYATFRSDTPGFIKVVKKYRKKLVFHSGKVHRDDFRGYLARKMKKIKSQLYPRPKMDIIHKVRKSIKEVLYLSEVDNGLKRKEAEFFDRMQDVIGSFHDKRVLLDMLKDKRVALDRIQRSAIKKELLSDKNRIQKLTGDYFAGK